MNNSTHLSTGKETRTTLISHSWMDGAWEWNLEEEFGSSSLPGCGKVAGAGKCGWEWTN